MMVLFAGPSGAGKTMAAHGVANALGRQVHPVDLAAAVAKYIGETEKRLEGIFGAVDHSTVVLFFDEADALFGRRTEVKDAHDRYANVEIDYLLQRVEQFDGIAILATNQRDNLDPAFLRRLRFLANVLPPGVPEQLAIWRIAPQTKSPAEDKVLDGLALEWLAKHPMLTGNE